MEAVLQTFLHVPRNQVHRLSIVRRESQVIAAEVAEEFLEKRLENWGRSYSDKRVSHAAGVLGRIYRAPYRQWIPLSEITITTPPDVLDAALVELAWRQMLGHRKELLRQHYMRSNATAKAFYRMCRVVGIKHWEYKAEIFRAKKEIAKTLDNFAEHGITGANLDRSREIPAL